jgi:putative Mg2+ transporter-C (MgtC) family protein
VELWLGKGVIPFTDLLWRFGAAALFGLLLGLDREARGKSAGVRAHMLVALSSATTMLVAAELHQLVAAAGQGNADPSRAIQGLAQAIGFLCAGVIFVSRGTVFGLTTAASLWMTSAVGMAAGAGMMRIALAACAYALFILTGLGIVKLVLGDRRPPQTDEEPDE